MPLRKSIKDGRTIAKHNKKNEEKRKAADEQKEREELAFARKAKPLLDRAKRMRTRQRAPKGWHDEVAAAQSKFIEGRQTQANLDSFKRTLDAIDKKYPK